MMAWRWRELCRTIIDDVGMLLMGARQTGVRGDWW